MDQTRLFENLNKQTTVLTPNRRLSASLHQYYQADQVKHGKLIWETPDILPLHTWLESLWLNHSSARFSSLPLLLNPIQEQFLWEKILAENQSNKPLLQLPQTAQLAKSAWALLKQWRIGLQHPIFQSAEDYVSLQTWMMSFETLLQQKNFIDLASLPEKIAILIIEKKILIKPFIILVGFTEISPELKHLLSICEIMGSQITYHEVKHKNIAATNKISLKDAEDEITTIARWAKSTLKKHPEAKIGCVLPHLDKTRDRVAQIFSQVFEQETLFNLSAGKSLLHYPIVQTAIHLLSLYKKKIPLEIMSAILTSPFVGEAEIERIKRSQLENHLRQHNKEYLDIQKSEHFTACSKLGKRIQAFLSKIDEHKDTQTFSEWADIFTQLLTLLGWPGERSLNSEEYQVVDAWMNTLSDFTTLDQITESCYLPEALARLQKILNQVIFQAKTPDAPIQVLGLLEAAGLSFDYLWLSQMDDLSWPPQPMPHPLIPKRLQRERQMPHATAERELMFCQRLLQQFQDNANFLILSHAEKKDELILQASPLIENFPSIDLNQLELETYLTPSERIYQSKQLAYLDDHQAPSVNVDEKITGGINIIKQQAICPFKAFAEWRLHAQDSPSPTPGLRSKDRGTIIHKALELIWQQLGDHSNLCQMPDALLNQLICTAIQDAFDITPHAKEEWIEYLSIEKKRLEKLLTEWLLIEKARPPFKVLHQEKNIEIALNQLTLSLRVDRIDELADGKKFIIDYKTGKNNDIKHWFSERPSEPQLPLYALHDKTGTIGISFAQIKSGESCFKGLSRYEIDIKGVKLLADIKQTENLSWEAQQTEWTKTLTELSEQFLAGRAEVDPKEGEETCTWCALKPLCRMNDENTCMT